MKVLLYREVKEKFVDILKQHSEEEVSIVHISPEKKEKAIAHAKEFDIIIGARVSKEFFEAASNLDYYIIPFAGIPSKDRDTLQAFPHIKVLNLHFHAQFVAEHAWTLLLASAKKLCPFHERLRKGDWTPRYERKRRGIALSGKLLLVLGYGHIGRKVAKMGKCFGMTVKAIKKTPEEAKTIDYIGTNEELHTLLPEADFIIVTLPLTDETRNYLDQKEFELMEEGVHIVNVGRGSIINEEAFYNALKSGKIGGAGIDTWWQYPENKDAQKHTFPSNHPIQEFENIVLSPHRAGLVKEFERQQMKRLGQLVNKLKNEEKVDLVDIKEGY